MKRKGRSVSGAGETENCLTPGSRTFDQLTFAVTMEPIFENTLFTVALSAGMAATAATATKPAANAYSTRSCPLESFQTFNFSR